MPSPGQTAPAPGRPCEPGAGGEIPTIKGNPPYDRHQPLQVVGPCSAIADPAERLRSCAAALTTRLVADAFLNSLVDVVATPAPGALEVVEGRVVERRVSGGDERINRRIRRLIAPLRGAALPDFLPEVLRSPGSGSALRHAGGPAPPLLADAVHPRLRRGPRGLPGQLISGDSGWLSTGDGLYAKVQYRS